MAEPVTSIEGIVKGKLPWHMVLYGAEEEAQMAQSSNPTIKVVLIIIIIKLCLN